MFKFMQKISRIFFDSLVFLARVKSFYLRKIAKRLKFGIRNIETLIDGENLSSVKFKEIALYSELQHFSYIDFESREPLGVTFQRRSHLQLNNTVLDSQTGILFATNGNLIAESSSWSPEYLTATFQTKPFRIVPTTKLVDTRPAINLTSNGFYHWLNEDLPQYLHLNRILVNPLTFVSNKRPDFVNSFLQDFSIEFQEVPRFSHFEEINFITRKSIVGWPHPKDIEVLKEFFKHYLNERTPGKRVYVSRISDSRSPLFERALVNLLINSGWKVLDLKELSLVEQVAEISTAEVLMGVHGAGLSGVNWMEEGSKLIELGTDRFVRCFQRLAQINKVEYLRINYNSDAPGLDIVKVKLKNLGYL